MSQYIDFFSRKDDTFIPIYSESQDSVLFQLLKDFAPHKKLRKLSHLSHADFLRFNQELNDELDQIDRSLGKYLEAMELPAKYYEPIHKQIKFNEKLTANVNELRKFRADILRAREQLRLFAEMADDAESIERYDEPKHKWGIYCGIEVPLDVTVADIAE